MPQNQDQQPPVGHATMTDVARMAGVSLKSVSRVINNEPHVTQRLREKVEAAIAALHYVPDTAARSLAGARSFTIGVLFDNPSPNYTMKVLSGAYRACVERQYHLRIDSIDSTADPDRLRQMLDALLRHSRADGFVLSPPLTDVPQLLDALEQRGVRYARLAPYYAPERSMAVCIDDAAAAARVAELLYANGHRHFGLLNGPDSHGAAHLRRQGFMDRLAALDASVVVSEAYGGFDFEQGIVAGLELLGGQAGPRPTAIFAGNDDSAAGAMAAATQLGLVVPRDLSVCGFDDSWVAKAVWPYLTTVFQPIEAMAYAAARMVIERGDPPADQRIQRLDFELIERASVGPAPGWAG